jgi:ketosteroid isomerase-like protein
LKLGKETQMPAQAPQRFHQLIQTVLNDKDIAGLMALYEDDCAVVPQPAAVVMGAN